MIADKSLTTKRINFFIEKLIYRYSYLIKCKDECISFAYGHTTLNTPVLVRSLKLSNVGLG